MAVDTETAVALLLGIAGLVLALVALVVAVRTARWAGRLRRAEQALLDGEPVDLVEFAVGMQARMERLEDDGENPATRTIRMPTARTSSRCAPLPRGAPGAEARRRGPRSAGASSYSSSKKERKAGMGGVWKAVRETRFATLSPAPARDGRFRA